MDSRRCGAGRVHGRDLHQFERRCAGLRNGTSPRSGSAQPGSWARAVGESSNRGATHSRLVLEVRCNWKLAVENYLRGPTICRRCTRRSNDYSRLEDHYCFCDAQDFAGQGSLAYRLSDVAGHAPASPRAMAGGSNPCGGISFVVSERAARTPGRPMPSPSSWRRSLPDLTREEVRIFLRGRRSLVGRLWARAGRRLTRPGTRCSARTCSPWSGMQTGACLARLPGRRVLSPAPWMKPLITFTRWVAAKLASGAWPEIRGKRPRACSRR